MDPTRLEPGTFVPSPANDLQGWKDIAAYLGKSVRAAQRWEQELGLPVHRLKTAAGQSIYARRAEIDEWKSRQEIAPRDPDAVEPPPPASRPFVSLSIAAGILAAIVALISAVAWYYPARVVVPATYHVAGSQLEARDAAGGVLWTYNFPPPLYAPPREVWRPRMRTRVFEVDFDSDGVNEALAVLASGPDHAHGSDVVFCFDASGKVLWRFEPTSPLVFASGAYTAPFVIRDVAISRHPGHPRVWLSVGHSVWWPGSVVELDREGHGHTLFVQSGQVNALAVLDTPDGVRVVAAGVNNDYARASLAVLDPDTLTHSPQQPGGGYECLDCGSATPLHYVLLPPTELVKVSGLPYDQAWELEVIGDHIHALTLETRAEGESMIYEFDNAMRLVRTAASDGFWGVHAAHPELGHTPEHCPDRAPRTILEWQGDGWRSETAPGGQQPVPGVARGVTRPPGS